ncbi:LLM class flavin-dependent oxidoreductase [Streptomyces sp. NPDC002328]|uniref:LLM class flavin-dependent oxidoreductase n=1 Tax=Streptomyces sp. NPDC002328 TaxID=3364642 RepID=UPI0036A57B7B
MTSSPGRGLLHLAAAVDQPRVDDIGRHVELVRLAERGGLDFVTLDDGSHGRGGSAGSVGSAGPGGSDGPGGAGGPGGPGGSGPDAPAVLSRAAAVTHRVGLVPTVAVAHTGPARVRAAVAAVAALDRVSRGRAGRWIEVAAAEDEARLADRGPAAPPTALWRETEEPAYADAELWEGGEGDTERGRPVRVIDATEGHARAVAARYADVALVRAANSAQARAVRDELRAAARESGRDPGSLRVLAALLIDLGDGEHAAEPGHGGGGPRQSARGPLYRGGPVDLADLIRTWHQDGAADGFHLTPVEPRRDLERLVNGTVALLQHRGLFRTFYPGSTLREHLGLSRSAPRYAVPGGAS